MQQKGGATSSSSLPKVTFVIGRHLLLWLATKPFTPEGGIGLQRATYTVESLVDPRGTTIPEDGVCADA